MGQSSSQPVKVKGSVSPGYESVKELFENNFKRGAEESAQLCVYVGEEKVVDLWCSVTDPGYTGNTLTNVFSSTKSLTAIAMASLEDKGLMKYTDKISSYWPEFGQNGKEDITVADLLRHEAGLAQFDLPLNVEDTLRENIKKNNIGSVIEQLTPHWPEEGPREYHSLTRGWVANEVFRRLEPRGRTIGEYLAEDVAKALGADVFVGVPQDRFNDYAPVENIGLGTVLKESMKTNTVGGAVDIGFFEFITLMNNFRKMFAEGQSKPVFNPYQDYDQKRIDLLFNKDVIRRGESSSANGNCSARGLALVAAAMANGGSVQGVQILSSKACKAFHEEVIERPIFKIFPTYFTQGGINKFAEEGGVGRDGYYGWHGYGGSVFQWYPEHRIGFAYTPTLLHWFDMTNGRGRQLQEEVVKCVKNRK